MAAFPKVFEEATGVEPNPPVRHDIRLKDDTRPSHVKPYSVLGDAKERNARTSLGSFAQGLDTPFGVAMGRASSPSAEERWDVALLRRLPQLECCYRSRLVPSASNRRPSAQGRPGSSFLEDGHAERVSLGPHGGGCH